MRIEVQWDARNQVLAAPKTPQAIRDIALPGVAMEALRRHRAQRGAVPLPDTFVFHGPEGKPLVPSTLRRQHLKPLLQRAGLPPETRIHDLRHGNASLLANRGTPLNVLTARLGHHSVRVTEVYTHSNEEAQRDAARTIGDALEGASRWTDSG